MPYLLVRIEAGEGVGEVHVLGGGQEMDAQDAHAQHGGEEGQKRPCAGVVAAGSFPPRAHAVGRVLLEPRQRPSDGVRLLHVLPVLMQKFLGIGSETHGGPPFVQRQDTNLRGWWV